MSNLLLKKEKKNSKISAPKLFTVIPQSAENIKEIIKLCCCNSKIILKKPFIKDVNRKKQLNFAKTCIKEDKI